MGTRPSTRFNGPGHCHARPPRCAECCAILPAHDRCCAQSPAAANSRRRRDDLRRALELVLEHGELYSVELADAMAWQCGHAKHVLGTLEEMGLLTSARRRCALSGHGRRYYRVADGDVMGTIHKLLDGNR